MMAIIHDREGQKAATELSAMDGGFGRTFNVIYQECPHLHC
ncbi:MAG TPA: hypothetical protein VJ722_01660 [Rhodanobacteraceae bacterium]|nr:hypothetical protein [Rhodanobacteraceae bacterium]